MVVVRATVTGGTVMTLDLSPPQLTVLCRALTRQLRASQDELAHTESHLLQHQLAADTRELEQLLEKLKPLAAKH